MPTSFFDAIIVSLLSILPLSSSHPIVLEAHHSPYNQMHAWTGEQGTSHLRNPGLTRGRAIPVAIANCQTGPKDDDAKMTIDWGNIHSLEELDACIFQVAADLRSTEALLAFLSSSGLVVSGPHPFSAAAMRTSYDHDGEGVLVSGTIQKSDLELNLGWLEMLGVHSLSISILLSIDGQPVDVNSSLTRT